MATVTLRSLEKHDLPQLNAWRNDPALMATLGANFMFIPQQVDDAWYDSYLASRDKALRLSILTPDQRYIGNVNLTSIHPINRSAELSIMIGDPSERGKGYGTQSVKAAVRHGFDDLALNRIYLQVLADNEAAIRTYQRCGFSDEGVKRQEVFKCGAFHDMRCMAILRSEFRY